MSSDTNNKTGVNKTDIYGFYRVADSEKMIERINLEVMQECAIKLENLLF